MIATRVLSQGVKAVSRGAQAAHGAAGLPSAPSWAGYWNWTTGLLIVMFILYLAKNNRLSVWIAFLGWGTPKSVSSAANTATSQGVLGQILNGPTGNAAIPATTPGQANAIPWGSVGNSVVNGASSFLNSGAGVVPKSAGGTN